jgi:microcystin-dependent protein
MHFHCIYHKTHSFLHVLKFKKPMAEPFLSEIRMMSFNFPPKGWAFCNGQTMAINQNQALFSLLGTMYGGDGRVTFNLPNLQARAPIHVGEGHTLAEPGGELAHTLNLSETPGHTHAFNAVAPANAATNVNNPNNAFLSNTTPAQLYVSTPNTPVTTLMPQAISPTGGSQPHNNLQPYLTINFCIALQGIFPSQS